MRKCRNIAILGGKNSYSKLGLPNYKVLNVRVRVNNIFKVRVNYFQKLGLGVIAYSRLGLLQS